MMRGVSCIIWLVGIIYPACLWDLRGFKKMKDMHLLDWPRDELLTAITEFVLLTVQMQNLTAQSRARLVATTSASTYIKSNKKRGRKSLAEKTAIDNMKINQYFSQQPMNTNWDQWERRKSVTRPTSVIHHWSIHHQQLTSTTFINNAHQQHSSTITHIASW